MTPLAERLRPKTLDEYIGQKHLVGPGAILRKMIDAGRISSFILWGPPGVGKTTLAQIIANKLETPFYTLSAVTSGVKDVREVIERAKSNRFFSQGSPILFIDEIHRFSKSQQDSLLGAVEQGTVTLIGATTENPSFEVIRPLLSRCQLYVLKSLEKEDLMELLQRAVTTDHILKERKIELKETTAILRYSGGDARKLLNILDLVVSSEANDPVVITDEIVTERLQQNPLAYDKDGEMHYDIISAFIKSIRGSDPDGAVYWLARMVEAVVPDFFCLFLIAVVAGKESAGRAFRYVDDDLADLAVGHRLAVCVNKRDLVYRRGLAHGTYLVRRTAQVADDHCSLGLTEALNYLKPGRLFKLTVHLGVQRFSSSRHMLDA